MRRAERERLIVAAAAALAIAVQAALAWHWNSREGRPPPWDAAVHLGTALDYREALGEGRLSGLLLTRLRPGHAAYPPLYHYTLMPLLGAEKPERWVVWLNLAYLGLFAAAAASIAWRLSGPWAAALALLFIGLSPMARFFREPFVDLPLAAAVAWTYAFLVRSRLYAERRGAWLVGLCAGLAMLCKWTAWVYLLPAWAAGLRRGTRPNLWRATGLAALIIAPWYLLNMPLSVPRVLESASLGVGEGDPQSLLGGLGFYFQVLIRSFSGSGLVLLLSGAVWALWKGRREGWRSPAPWLAGWLAFSMLFWSRVSNKDDRYILPAAGALPALGAAGLPPAGLAAGAAIILFNAWKIEPPTPGEWPVREMLEEAARLAPERPTVALCVLANHPSLNTTSMIWLARHGGFSRLRLGCREGEIPEWADAVLLKTGDPGYFLSDRTRAILAQVGRAGTPFSAVYEERRRWALPDGSEAVLYTPRAGLPAPRGVTRLPRLAVGTAALEDVELRALDDGRYRLKARALHLGKLDARVWNVEAELEGARLVAAGGTVYVLGVERVRPLSARLDWNELSQGLSRRARRPVLVAPGPDGSSAWARLGPVETLIAFAPEGEELVLRLRSLHLAGRSVPGARLLSRRVSLAPDPPRRPFALALRISAGASWAEGGIPNR